MKLIVSEQAKDSLRRSLRYLSKYYAREYLDVLRRRIGKELLRLKDQPGAGQFEPELEKMEMEHRRVIVGPFKIIYRVFKDTASLRTSSTHGRTRER